MKRVLIAATIAVALVACSSANQAASTADAQTSATTAPTPKPNLPVTYRVKFDTTAGPFVVAVIRDEAPLGADHFLELVKAKYYDGQRFYRVVPHFVVQWGSSGNPATTQKWNVDIPDDRVIGTNARGTITFADSGANTRSTALFINLGDNARLDSDGFAPFGYVVSGMNNVEKIFPGYGEVPDQGQIAALGNAYLNKNFPHLDYIRTARVMPK